MSFVESIIENSKVFFKKKIYNLFFVSFLKVNKNVESGISSSVPNTSIKHFDYTPHLRIPRSQYYDYRKFRRQKYNLPFVVTILS